METISGQGLTPKLILYQAAALFSSQGYRGTSLNDVAKSLDVTKPALYYYFKNKHDILNSIFEVIMGIYLEEAEKIDKQEISAELKLKALIEAHITAVLENKDFSKIFFKEMTELNEQSRGLLIIKLKKYEGIFSNVINQGIKDSKIKDVNITALIKAIFGMTNWLYYWFEDGKELNKKEITDLYVVILTNGYLIESEEA